MTRNPVTIDLKAPTSLADILMKHHPIHHLPVLEGEVLRGLVSQSDLYRNMLSFFFVENEREHHEFLDSFLDLPSIMTSDPLSLQPEDTLGQALELMQTRKIGCVPVVDKANRLVGILTESDMLRLFTHYLP